MNLYERDEKMEGRPGVRRRYVVERGIYLDEYL